MYAEGARHFAANGVAEHTEVYSAATGIQGRFEIGGKRITRKQAALARR